MMVCFIFAEAGYGDYGRWYSHTHGIETVIFGIIGFFFIIATIYTIIQKLKNDKEWQTGGCLVVIVITIIIFVAFMSNMEKTRHKDIAPTRQTPSSSIIQHNNVKQTNFQPTNTSPTNTFSSNIPSSDICEEKYSGTQRMCGHCEGRGKVIGLEEISVEEDCPNCSGNNEVCFICSSTGKFIKKKKVERKVNCIFCNGSGYIEDRMNK